MSRNRPVTRWKTPVSSLPSNVVSHILRQAARHVDAPTALSLAQTSRSVSQTVRDLRPVNLLAQRLKDVDTLIHALHTSPASERPSTPEGLQAFAARLGVSVVLTTSPPAEIMWASRAAYTGPLIVYANPSRPGRVRITGHYEHIDSKNFVDALVGATYNLRSKIITGLGGTQTVCTCSTSVRKLSRKWRQSSEVLLDWTGTRYVARTTPTRPEDAEDSRTLVALLRRQFTSFPFGQA